MSTPQRTIDELEIRNVIARLALATDLGDLDEYASLFTSDAHLEMRAEPGKPQVVPPTKGRDAILAGGQKRRADGMTGPGSHVAHTIQTSAVTVSGDSATARTYVVIYKNTHTKPEPLSLRVYNDEFVHTSDGWKLASRYIDPV
jgi:hypothetical protein